MIASPCDIGPPPTRGVGEHASAFLEADGDLDKSEVGGSMVKPLFQRQEPAGGGNLFLVALKLRFEEDGSWEAALGSGRPSEDSLDLKLRDGASTSTPPAADESAGEAADEAAAAPPLSARSVSSESPSKVKSTWKDWAGRENGGEGYRAFDIVRGLGKLLLGKGAQQAAADAALSFGVAGGNVELLPDPADAAGAAERALVIAFRLDGAGEDSVALTSRPLPTLASLAPLSARRPSMDASSIPAEPTQTQYYFEFEVTEVDPLRPRTLSFGFAWEPWESWIDGDAPSAGISVASRLRYSFIVGGELPRYHFGGRDRGKLLSWRPRIDVVDGSVLGALLEVREDAAEGSGADSRALRLLVFQDGALRTEVVEKIRLSADSWAEALRTGPHGVVDVCGNVRCVQLRQGGMPPQPTPRTPRTGAFRRPR